MFLQGRSFNPYLERHIFMLLDNLFVHITSNRGRLAVTSKLGLTLPWRIMFLCLVRTLLLCEQSDAIFSAVNNNKRSSKVANKDSVNFTTILLL